MANLGELEIQVQDYAAVSQELTERVTRMKEEIDAVRKRHLESITTLAKKAAQEKAILLDAIDESRELFVKPKSITIHGVTVGLRKKKGKIEMPNESGTIKRIRKQMPDLADVLIKDNPRVIKKALNNLSASDLKKLGVEITADTEEPIVKSALDEVEKLVTALIDEELDHQLPAGA